MNVIEQIYSLKLLIGYKGIHNKNYNGIEKYKSGKLNYNVVLINSREREREMLDLRENETNSIVAFHDKG